MTVKNNFPNILPTLNLNFAKTKKLDPRITFTRASTASYYDGETVSKAEENLLIRSQEFDQSPWNANALGTALAPTRAANYATAPDGTTTADRIQFSLNGGTTTNDVSQLLQNVAVTSGATYTLSIWVKSTDGVSTYDMQLAGPGVIANTPVTGTWTRFIATGISATSSFDVQIRLRGGQTPANPNTADVLIWGAQLEQRSSVTAYTPTTTSPITNYIPTLLSAPAGVARFDHDPVTGESKGLLIEEQRVNYVTSSGVIDTNTYWTTYSGTSNRYSLIAPDGSTDGRLIENTNATGLGGMSSTQLSSVPSGTLTYSVYVKKGTSASFRIQAYGITSAATFLIRDLQWVDGVPQGTNCAVSSVGGGWFRVSTQASNPQTQNVLVYVIPVTTTGLLGSTGFWGAQLEFGAFPTSYIPTVASQVTRLADSASMQGSNFSSWYNPSESTAYAEFDMIGIDTVHGGSVFNLGSSASTNGILAYRGTSSSGMFAYIDSNSSSTGSITLNALQKFAFAYNGVSNAAVLNAGNTPSVAGFVSSPANKLLLGNDYSLADPMSGHIRRFAYYPQRLTNSQLQALTT